MELKHSIVFALCKDQLRDRGLGERQGFNYPSHPATAAKSVMMMLCILTRGRGTELFSATPSAPPLSVKKETKKKRWGNSLNASSCINHIPDPSPRLVSRGMSQALAQDKWRGVYSCLNLRERGVCGTQHVAAPTINSWADFQQVIGSRIQTYYSVKGLSNL